MKSLMYFVTKRKVQMFDRESEGQNLFIDIFFSNFVADTMLNNLRVFFFIVHLFYSELCTKNYFCVCVIE